MGKVPLGLAHRDLRNKPPRDMSGLLQCYSQIPFMASLMQDQRLDIKGFWYSARLMGRKYQIFTSYMM